jgi:site-specific DNA recombinase
MKRAATYIRMSTDDQEGSPERQRQQVLPYCQRNGYAVVREYVDEGLRGWDDTRPSFVQMLNDARKGMFDVIVIDERSRLMRANPVDFIRVVWGPLKDAGVRVEAVDGGPVDFDDMTGYILSGIGYFKSKDETVQLARRTTTGLMMHASNGKLFAGRPLWGYRFATKDGVRLNLEVDTDHPERADVVRRVFTSYLDKDMSAASIAVELNRDGVPTPTGEGQWRKRSVHAILTNARYAGSYTFGVVGSGRYFRSDGSQIEAAPKGGPKSSRRNAGEYLCIPGSHPAIVPPRVFDRVQERLAANRVRTSPARLRANYPLSGKLVCSDCGSPMYGRQRHSGAKREPAYQCSASMEGAECGSRTVTEKAMLALLGEVLTNSLLLPENRDRLLAEMERQRAGQPGKDSAVADLTKKVARLQGQIAKASKNLALLDEEDIHAVKGQLREWRGELAAAKGELDRLSSTADEGSPVALVGRVERLVDALQSADPALVRQVVQESIDHVDLEFAEVPKDKVTRYPLAGGVVHLCADQSGTGTGPAR